MDRISGELDVELEVVQNVVKNTLRERMQEIGPADDDHLEMAEYKALKAEDRVSTTWTDSRSSPWIWEKFPRMENLVALAAQSPTSTNVADSELSGAAGVEPDQAGPKKMVNVNLNPNERSIPQLRFLAKAFSLSSARTESVLAEAPRRFEELTRSFPGSTSRSPRLRFLPCRTGFLPTPKFILLHTLAHLLIRG